MTDHGLELNDIRFSYGSWEVRYELVVNAGDLVALIGPSGAGKSTLLSLIAGFETAIGGSISVNGDDITDLPPAKRPVTTLFQEHNLFAHLSAAQNVGLGISPSLRLSAGDRTACDAALAKVGLNDKTERLPRELSGGERQRVAIARALVMRRPLLLLDEPFAALGPALRRDMLDLVNALRRETGMTIVMVSHDPADARRVADRTAFISDGRITAFGETDELLSRKTPPELVDYLG